MDLETPEELSRALGGRARARRLEQDLTQLGLAARARVSLATIKRFERSGGINSEALIRIAIALGATSGIARLFEAPPIRSLDDPRIAEPRARKRGRRT